MHLLRRHHVAFLFLAFAMLPASGASAQCATGVNTGGGNCMPPDAPGMPGYNPSGGDAVRSGPRPVWKKTWGAIAIDVKSGKAGTVTGHDGKADAIDAAMHDCQGRGGVDCRLEVAYFNQCAAIGWGSDGYGSARAGDIRGAEDFAMSECSKAASGGCKIVYSACSEARRLR